MGKCGRIVSFKCLGTNRNDTLRWLAVENGNVCLVDIQTHQYAKWGEHVLGNGDLLLECMGLQIPKRFLYGRTSLRDGDVSLTDYETAQAQGSGGRWSYDVRGESIALRCLGKTQGGHWIDGITMTGRLQLVPEHEVERKSGTRWEITTVEKSKADMATGGASVSEPSQLQSVVNKEVLARIDEVIAREKAIQWVVVALAVLLCLAGIAGIISAIATGQYVWTIPSAFISVVILWPIKHIGRIRDRNIHLAAAPTLISQLPQHLAEAEIQKLLDSMYKEG